MKVKTDHALQVLCTLLIEDRVEVRNIRNKINNIIATLSISSFAITAFLIDKKIVHSIKVYGVVIDLLFIIMMIFAYWRLMVDLRWARSALESREQLIKDMKEHETIELDPFPPLNPTKNQWIDNDMKWVLGFGVLLMSLKIMAELCLVL